MVMVCKLANVIQHRIIYKVLHFGCKNTLFSYQLEGKCLEKVSERKDLGIVIRNNLKVSKQSTEAYANANKMLGVINITIVYKYTHNLLVL